MDLVSILMDLGAGFTFLGGSFAADSISTYFGVDKWGIECEQNIPVRKIMEKEGVINGLVKFDLKCLVIVGYLGTMLYGLDSLGGIESNWINGHNILFYGLGTFKYGFTLHKYV